MSPIAPGTPCYIVQLAEMSALNGRVVEVVAGPTPSEDLSGDEYEVRASWAHELFPGHKLMVARKNLKPITPPDKTDATRRCSELQS